MHRAYLQFGNSSIFAPSQYVKNELGLEQFCMNTGGKKTHDRHMTSDSAPGVCGDVGLLKGRRNRCRSDLRTSTKVSPRDLLGAVNQIKDCCIVHR